MKTTLFACVLTFTIATVPPAERSKWNILLLVSNAYYDALEQSNGEAAPL
jgi:hypothetical protein